MGMSDAMSGIQWRRLAPSGLAAKALDGGGYRSVIRLCRSPFRPEIAGRTVWGNLGSIIFCKPGSQDPHKPLQIGALNNEAFAVNLGKAVRAALERICLGALY